MVAILVILMAMNSVRAPVRTTGGVNLGELVLKIAAFLLISYYLAGGRCLAGCLCLFFFFFLQIHI